MQTAEPKSDVFQYVTGFLMILFTIILVFAPNLPMFKSGSYFVVQITFVFFGLGFLFLLFGREKLMLISFLCTGILCLFLKRSFNDVLMLPSRTNTPSLRVAHVNLSSLGEELESSMDRLSSIEADIISFQEVTPMWTEFLDSHFSEKFPYHSTLVRIDIYGLAVYSKYPFKMLDTIYAGDIPNLTGRIIVDENTRDEVYFISSHLTPSPSNIAEEEVSNHLELIAKLVNQYKAPIITFGDYNLVSWSDEIRVFREKASLRDSRRSFIPGFPNSFYPIDHVFYSEHFECTSFESILDDEGEKMGIIGRYQFKPTYSNASKTIK